MTIEAFALHAATTATAKMVFACRAPMGGAFAHRVAVMTRFVPMVQLAVRSADRQRPFVCRVQGVARLGLARWDVAATQLGTVLVACACVAKMEARAVASRPVPRASAQANKRAPMLLACRCAWTGKALMVPLVRLEQPAPVACV